ncbi:MAG: nucleoside-triphosphatase [Spirochaetia bacterium]|nr:nucleoside-triphosphatase [Spirochaetia bacterium]
MNCKNIYIISGDRGSGKTTLTEKFISILQHNGIKVGGIITRSAPTERYVMKDSYDAVDILTGEQHPLLTAAAGAERIKSFGRFILHEDTFSWAASRIEEAIDTCGAIIIDELGPLEIKREGYYHIAKKVVSRYKGLILFVVRSGLVDQITKISECDPQKIVQLNAGTDEADILQRFAYEVFENE